MIAIRQKTIKGNIFWFFSVALMLVISRWKVDYIFPTLILKVIFRDFNDFVFYFNTLISQFF